MPLDPGLILQFTSQMNRERAEQPSYADVLGKLLALKGQQQQQQMQGLQLQQASQQQQDEQALRKAMVLDPEGNIDRAATIRNLSGLSNPMAVAKMQQQWSKMDLENAGSAKAMAEAKMKQQEDMRNRAVQEAQTVASAAEWIKSQPDQAAAWDSVVDHFGMTQEKGKYTPEKLDMYERTAKGILAMSGKGKGGAAQSPLGKLKSDLAAGVITPEEYQLGLKKATTINPTMFSIAPTPPGYRLMPDGTMQAIPGGPADLKEGEKQVKEQAAFESSTSGLDRLKDEAKSILSMPGLKGNYGLRGVIPNAPGSDAANAAARLETLKSQTGFTVLQAMRDASKTGGALGAISDKENAMLQANLANLDKAQSYEEVQKSLKRIIAFVDESKDRLAKARQHRVERVETPASERPKPGAKPKGHGSADAMLSDLFGGK